MVEIKIFRHREASELEPGDVLFSEGDDGDVMFAVVEGEIEVVREGRILETVRSGGILGELALIDPAPRSATATARTAARVVRVSREDFTFLVHEHPTFALQVMSAMAERQRRTNEGFDSSTH